MGQCSGMTPEARPLDGDNPSVDRISDTDDSRQAAVRIWLRLYTLDGEEIAVLAQDDDALIALPRIGDDYVTAARYGVPVVAVEHDTVTGVHYVSVFLDEHVEDADPLIAMHIDDGWTLVRDERGSADGPHG